jgi:hypothetical protein
VIEDKLAEPVLSDDAKRRLAAWLAQLSAEVAGGS